MSGNPVPSCTDFLTVLICDDNNGGTAHTKEFADSLQFKTVVCILFQICQVYGQLVDWQPQQMRLDRLITIIELVVNNSVLS